jgi:hypothetical protein
MTAAAVAAAGAALNHRAAGRPGIGPPHFPDSLASMR